MEVDYELETNISRKELRVLLLHEFRLNHKATEAANNICSTMDTEVLSIRTAQHWFNRFKNDHFEHVGYLSSGFEYFLSRFA